MRVSRGGAGAEGKTAHLEEDAAGRVTAHRRLGLVQVHVFQHFEKVEHLRHHRGQQRLPQQLRGPPGGGGGDRLAARGFRLRWKENVSEGACF